MSVVRQDLVRWANVRWAAYRWLPRTAVLLVCAFGISSAAPSGLAVHKDENFITAQTSGILDIEAGECFDDPAYLPSAGEAVVLYRPCPEQADNQSYGFAHATDSPWERTKLAAFGWDQCGTAFARRWPGAVELDFYPILPTEETWADGDRDIMCVVYNPDGKLRDSALPRSR